MGQTNKTISYHGRLSIPFSLIIPPHAKSMSKDKFSILQSQDINLFKKEKYKKHRKYTRQTQLHENEFSGRNLAQTILSRADSSGKVTKSSSIGEKYVFNRGQTKSSIGRAFKTFCKNVKIIGKGS